MSAPKFTKLVLTLPGRSTPLPSAIPLVIPDNTIYDKTTEKVILIKGAKRTGLTLNEEALVLLRGIKKPVAVLSICGPYRTGKSYILSRVLGASNAFHLGHTIKACTHGIWMGTTVLECEDFVIVLLDSEGIDAVSSSQSSDAGVLVMTILLSSYMIYNSIQVANNTDLEKLQAFTALSSSIAVRQDKVDSVTESEFRRHLPKFMWLFRDFTLKLVDEDGRRISPHDYLIENVLSCDDESDPNDKVKKAILVFFPTIDCVMLPPPSADPDVMQDIEHNEENLTKKFNEGVKNLVGMLLKTVPPKLGYHSPNPMTGETLADLAIVYLDAINKPDSIPCLDNNWETVITLGISRAVEKMRLEYEQEMEAATAGKLPMELETIEQDKASGISLCSLMEIHRRILEEKVKELRSSTKHLISESSSANDRDGSDGLREQYTIDFINQIVRYEHKDVEGQGGKDEVTGGVLFKYIQRNYSLSLDTCTQLFDELYQPVIEKVTASPPIDKVTASPRKPSYTIEALTKDLNEAKQQYLDKAVGPAKWEVLESKKQLVSETLLHLETINKKDQELLEEHLKAEEAELKQKATQEQMKELEVMREEERDMHQKQLQYMAKEYEEKVANVTSTLQEEIKQERRKQEELQKAHLQEMADMARRNEQRLFDELKRLQSEIDDYKNRPPRRRSNCILL